MPELAEAHYRAEISEPVIHGEAVTLDYEPLLKSLREAFWESEYLCRFQLFSQARKQLQELARRGQNWDSYGAEPPNDLARVTAERLLGLLQTTSVSPTRVVASSEGGVAICFVNEDRYADFECFNDGEILAVRYRGTDEPIVWEVAPEDEPITAAIEQIRAHINA